MSPCLIFYLTILLSCTQQHASSLFLGCSAITSYPGYTNCTDTESGPLCFNPIGVTYFTGIGDDQFHLGFVISSGGNSKTLISDIGSGWLCGSAGCAVQQAVCAELYGSWSCDNGEWVLLSIHSPDTTKCNGGCVSTAHAGTTYDAVFQPNTHTGWPCGDAISLAPTLSTTPKSCQEVCDHPYLTITSSSYVTQYTSTHVHFVLSGCQQNETWTISAPDLIVYHPIRKTGIVIIDWSGVEPDLNLWPDDQLTVTTSTVATVPQSVKYETCLNGLPACSGMFLSTDEAYIAKHDIHPTLEAQESFSSYAFDSPPNLFVRDLYSYVNKSCDCVCNNAFYATIPQSCLQQSDNMPVFYVVWADEQILVVIVSTISVILALSSKEWSRKDKIYALASVSVGAVNAAQLVSSSLSEIPSWAVLSAWACTQLLVVGFRSQLETSRGAFLLIEPLNFMIIGVAVAYAQASSYQIGHSRYVTTLGSLTSLAPQAIELVIDWMYTFKSWAMLSQAMAHLGLVGLFLGVEMAAYTQNTFIIVYCAFQGVLVCICSLVSHGILKMDDERIDSLKLPAVAATIIAVTFAGMVMFDPSKYGLGSLTGQCENHFGDVDQLFMIVNGIMVGASFVGGPAFMSAYISRRNRWEKDTCCCRRSS